MSRDVMRALCTGLLITFGSVLASIVVVGIWVQAQTDIQRSDVLLMALILPMTIAPGVCLFILRDRMRTERLARENYRLAHMDELTGLPNRRAYFDAARQLQARAGFVGRHFYCAIADVDNFKRVNDRWGHEVGDQVLREIAIILNTKMPEDCIAARLGGEEFVLAGMFASQEEADSAFRLLVTLIANRPVETESGPLAITISLGYCEGQRTSELSSLLSLADRALYAAKRFGKNRAVDFASPDPVYPQETASSAA